MPSILALACQMLQTMLHARNFVCNMQQRSNRNPQLFPETPDYRKGHCRKNLLIELVYRQCTH